MSIHKFAITRISDGLQFGHGQISGRGDIPEELDYIIHHSGDILVPIDRDDSGQMIEDDGCGDGRGVATVFRSRKTLKRSLHRAKVFGGSVAMTAASLIGSGQARKKSLKDVFGDSVKTLKEKDMDFGGHTDEHAHGDNCGCGAIDRAPEAILAALKYEEPIRAVIDKLGTGNEQLDAVYENFRAYVSGMPDHTKPYKGREVMDDIIGAGKVVKQLGGEHRERRIILNTVRDYTVNQRLIREGTAGQAQAFAVDIWRLQDIAANLFPGDQEAQTQAYLSELVYTLAIAAVLTKGDLPVDMVQGTPSPLAI